VRAIMSDENATSDAAAESNDAAAPAPEPDKAAADAPASAPKAPSAPPAAADTPEQKLEAAIAESARLRDQLLRTAADFDNFRKRSRREADDATKRGRETAIKDLLPVFDNLERAATHSEGAADAKALGDGVRMVVKQFVDTLDKMGIKRVPSVGQPFDPTLHEAIQHIESAEHPAGVIAVEVQPGYMLGDRLLRAAMVVVSKGAA
jgi:molecular chaperone GrpE